MSEQTKCHCDGCMKHRDFIAALKSVDNALARHVFEQLFEQLFHLEDDVDYTNANLDGSWHSSPFKRNKHTKRFVVKSQKWHQVYPLELADNGRI